ncbi:MAG: FtsX-like permease family protein [Anaerolineae bacterium]|jgi:putative ABC transport system permease protein
MKHTISMALRSLLARPSRTLLTLGGIVLGVAVILAISITNQSTLDSVTNIFSAASGKANLVVISATDDEEGFAERARGIVLNAPGVQEAIPSLQMPAFMAGQNFRGEMEMGMLGIGASRLIVYGIDPVLDQSVREYTIVEGNFLPPDLDPYELILVKDYADEQEIEVGDDVDFLTESGFETVRVVGLMAKQGAGQTNNGTFGVMPLGAAQEIFSRVGDLDQIDIVATSDYGNQTELDALKSALEARLGSAYTVTYPASQGKRVVQMLDVYQMGLNFFSVIAIVVGAFLIYNTFMMTVVERTREIGMLRTVGMTAGQVMGLIMTESVLLGAVGVALGVGAGTLLARGLIRAMESLVGQTVSAVQLPIGGLTLSIGVGIGVTLFSSGIPALQAGRISPLEALRARANPQEQWWVRSGWPWGIALLVLSVAGFYWSFSGSSTLQFVVGSASIMAMSLGAMLVIPATAHTWVRILSPLLRRLYGAEGQLGNRNVERARQRTTMTVIALMVSIGMVYSIQALTTSFSKDIDDWMEGYMGGDLYVWSTQSLRYDLSRRLEAVPGVAAVTPMRQLEVKAILADGSEDTIQFIAYDPASYKDVTALNFVDNETEPDELMDLLGEGDVVFVNTVLADRYDIEPGESIRLATRRGQRDFEVVALVSEYSETGSAIDGSWKDLRRYFGINDVSAFLVKLVPDASQAEVMNQMERLYGERMHLTIDSNEDMKAQATTLLSQAFGMFDVLALIAVIVAALGVINTLTMSVLERTREIGMLRGMGMTRWQVVRMILAEAATVGVMGGAFGVAYGLFMSRVFIGGANLTQGYRLAHSFPVDALVAAFAIALVISQFAAAWPARRAARLEVIEAIQFE